MVIESLFAAGTPVRVQQRIRRSGQDIVTETFGVVESWGELPTGSWFAHGKNDKLWLKRLCLRKADGEQTMLVIDQDTAIAKLEAVKGA
jgi:hypothetical protein